MKRLFPFLVVLLIPVLAYSTPAPQRGIQVTLRTSQGESFQLYEESHALVIGNGNYTNGWDPLPGALRDVREVAGALERNGFEVTLKTDLTRDEFMTELTRFSRIHGAGENNRLLFYYAGHGHTEKTVTGDDFGYLVMVDSPLPHADPAGFALKTVDMQTLVSDARMIRAKHVLYLFDSCFSGTVLNLRERVTPKAVSNHVRHPVRQFITAGRADEPVPDHSVFVQAFLNLLEGREPEPIPDGYITGEELGLFLKNKVPEYNPSQNPQYGKIRDPRLDQGDFVFLAGGSAVITRPDPPPAGEPVTGSLKVITRPAGAKVYVKEGFVGASPVELKGLSMGQVSVRASLSGYQDGKETVWIQAGKETQVTLLLNPIPTTGSLEVRSEPSGALWYLDGAYVGTTPGDMASVPQGGRTVTVKKEGFQDWEQTVTITVGATRKVQADLAPVKRDPKAGEIWTDPATGMPFVWVPGGCYMMGQTEAEKRYLIRDAGEDAYKKFFGDEVPRHEVCVDGFWMGRTEVTVDQFRRFVEATGRRTDAERDGGCYVYEGEWKKKAGTTWRNPPTVEQHGNHPVTCVSWNDAKAYAQWISQGSPHAFRLPTEAEWEYACRGGATSIRFWGDDPGQACGYANVADQAAKQRWSGWTIHECNDGYATTAPVGAYKPNPFGLYDMLGNVWEWCEDGYAGDAYSKHSRNNPIYDTGGAGRVIRGGSWDIGPGVVRCAFRRRWVTPGYGNSNLGFRLLRTY